MLNKKLIGAAAFAAALAGGGLAGALLGSPSVSGAQETPTTTAPADGSGTAPADHPGFPGRGGPHGDMVRPSLEVVASQLGISVDELRTSLQDGTTIADLAADKGVDLDALIAAVVDDASARIDQAVTDGDLTQERADELKAGLTDVVTRFVNGELRGPDGDHGPGFGHGGPGFGHGPGLDAAATALGMTADELRTELESGKTVAEVAQEKGVDVQTVIDAMVDQATQDITQRITDFVNGVSPADDGGN